MFKNQIQYNKLYRNGILYAKGFRNGQQILGNPLPVDSSLLLDIPFNGDFENKVWGGIQMEVAGGAPTFSNGAAIFNGSQSIKTATPLYIGTDKVTICFWLKTVQTSVNCIVELTDPVNYYNTFYSFINNWELNKIDFALQKEQNDGLIIASKSATPINDDVFRFIGITLDRSANDLKIFVNGINDGINIANNNAPGNFLPTQFYIGQRLGTSFGFIGEMKKFKLYNRVLTQQEINELMLL